MKVAVRFFGPQASLVGSRELLVELQDDAATTAHLLARLGQVEPSLAPSLRHSRVAINHAFAADTQRISPGDEVALIGMLGGG